MNAYAIFAVNEHLEYLIDDATRNRVSKAGKPSLRSRIASALDKVRFNVASSTYEMTSLFPKLEDYPHRG